jgi:hypothetical protein
MQTMSEFTSISDSLALMADPALQQFAQMHKDDPFSLALAVSESNRRKKLRAAQQGVAGMQQQPPVADQEIAQMNAPVMPENVGIGALPAPSMAGMPMGGITGEEEMEPQTMAGGGMVAFRDGGGVERYAPGGMPPAETEAAERARRLVRMAQARAAFSGRMPFTYGLTPGAAAAGLGVAGIPIGIAGGLTSAMEAMRAEGYPVDPRGEFATEATPEEMAFDAARRQREAVVPSAPAKATVSQSGPRNSPAMVFPSAAEQLRLAAAGEEIPVASAAAPGAGRGPAAPPRRPAAPAAAAAPGATPTTTSGDLNDLASLFSTTLAAQNYTDPAAAQLTALETKEREAAEAEKTALERDQARFAEAFKGREARLGKREEEIGKFKDTNTGLALLNAGLAIMSTPGGLATAIGKGAQVGTQQFASGLDKIRSAQEKLDEARDRTEELKLNRDEMSAKEVRAAESKIRQVGVDAQKRGIDGLRQAAGVNEARAKTIFDKTVQVGTTREEITGRKDVAAMQERGATARANTGLQATLNSPERLAFAAELRKTITEDKPQGDAVEAYRKLMELKREPMSIEQMRKDWTDMTKRMQISQDYPNVKTFEDYMTVMNAGGGGSGGGGFAIVGSRPAK